MDDNIRTVLALVQSGRITAEEAERLISALSQKGGEGGTGTTGAPSARTVAPPASPATPIPVSGPFTLPSPAPPSVPAPPLQPEPVVPPTPVLPPTPVAPSVPAPGAPFLAEAPAAPAASPPPPEARTASPSEAGTASSTADPATARLATGDLLLQIADDPSIPENEKLNVIIHATALICTVIALQPIPGVDVFLLTPIFVASVMAMSHVMGAPIGKNGAGEIVASLLGVVGLGLVAEQLVLAGAKVLLPLFGGLSLIPLVYAATYGMGWAARAVLEARRSDRRISDAEIRRIKEEAERRAKSERRDWSLAAIKSELDTWRARAEAYKQYETDHAALFLRQSAMRGEVDRLSREVAELAAQKATLQVRLADPSVRGGEPFDRDQLEAEVANLDAQWIVQGGVLDTKIRELNGVMWRLETLIEARFAACYPGVQRDPEVIEALALLPASRLNALERQVALLQYDPAKADYRSEEFLDAAGSPIRCIEFDTDGRLYLEMRQDRAVIRCIGDRRTQDRDIARLKRLD